MSTEVVDVWRWLEGEMVVQGGVILFLGEEVGVMECGGEERVVFEVVEADSKVLGGEVMVGRCDLEG